MSDDMISLRGKKILVTGATSGIGADFVALAVEKNASVFCMGRDESALTALSENLSDGILGTLAAPIVSIDGFKRELRSVSAEVGALDGVLHCAGFEGIGSIKNLGDKNFEEIFSGSVCGTAAILAASARKGFLKDGSSIALMSSVTAKRPQAGMAFYSASKAAVDAMLSSAMHEFAPRSIRVNSIVAGAVRTPMLEKSLSIMPSGARDKYEASHPLGFGTPRDISIAAAFLLSDAARWITGTNLVVDGGFLSK